jgi:N-acetylglucosaminyldiphosphoundecaprenol N-acetyl-beta-D-mannosaminyltransferase
MFTMLFNSRPAGEVDYACSVEHNPARNGLHVSLMSCEESEQSVVRANVLGVGVSALNLDSATAAISRALETRTKGYICVTGVHGVSEAQGDSQFRGILNNAFLNTPDGMPMVWMGRLQGFGVMRRVYGPDLMLRVCEASVKRGFTHYLYGGAEGVAQTLKERLEVRFPGLKIVGTTTPPFRPLTSKEEEDLASEVSHLKPDIFWIGLSTPKQERFMASHWQKLDATLFAGVGAAFDFHAGRVRQAPRWMQRSGLEWFFRLACEPRRLWRRYLKNNPLFVLRACAQLTGLRKYEVNHPSGDYELTQCRRCQLIAGAS